MFPSHARVLRPSTLLALSGILCLGVGCKSSHGGSTSAGTYDVEVEAPPGTPGVVAGKLQGPMDQATLDGYLARERPRLQACRDQELLVGHPDAAQAVYEFELRLSPTGQRHQVTLVRTTHPAEVSLEKCLTDILAGIQFPGFQGDPFVGAARLHPTAKP